MRLILFATFSLLALALCAQHNITYDYLDTTAIKHSDVSKPGATTVAEGEMCRFIILNVNTFLYEVSVDGEIVNLHSEQPQAFQLFFKAADFTGEAANVNASSENQKQNSVQGKASTDASLYENAMKTYSEKLKGFRDNLVTLEDWKIKYDGLLNIVCAPGKKGDDIITDVKAHMTGNTPEGVVSKGMNDYKKTLASLGETIQAIGQLSPEEKDKKQDDLKELLSLQTKITEFGYPDFFNRFSVLFKRAESTSSYYVVSPPVTAEKDYINFKITITPRKDLPANTPPLFSRSFSYPIRVRNNIKIDFSTGVFFAFDEARGRSYRLEPVPGDTQHVRIAYNTPSAFALPALGAAVHGSWRFNPAFAFGGMLGLGLNSAKITDVNYYLGLSGIFGWRERFILNVGYAFNQVDYLGKNYYIGQTFAKNSIAAENLTEKTLRGGLFVGITFNITNKKEGQ